MDFADVQALVLNFRDARSWKQFHNPKDLAISINLEASELLEIFQWSGADTDVPPARLEHAKEELADVMIYCIYLADVLGVDPAEIIADKMRKNAQHYPVDTSRGNATKYTEL